MIETKVKEVNEQKILDLTQTSDSDDDDILFGHCDENKAEVLFFFDF